MDVLHRFNRREDEFETLKDYNDYLNEVEDLTFNLIYQIDIEATEVKLKRYKEENDAAILENLRLEAETSRDAQARQAAEQQATRLRREAQLREDQDVRREREEARQDVLNKLASGDGDAEMIAREGQTHNSAQSPQQTSPARRPACRRFVAVRRRVRSVPNQGPEAAAHNTTPSPRSRSTRFDGMTESRDYYVPPGRLPVRLPQGCEDKA